MEEVQKIVHTKYFGFQDELDGSIYLAYSCNGVSFETRYIAAPCPELHENAEKGEEATFSEEDLRAALGAQRCIFYKNNQDDATSEKQNEENRCESIDKVTYSNDPNFFEVTFKTMEPSLMVKFTEKQTVAKNSIKYFFAENYDDSLFFVINCGRNKYHAIMVEGIQNNGREINSEETAKKSRFPRKITFFFAILILCYKRKSLLVFLDGILETLDKKIKRRQLRNRQKFSLNGF